MLPRFFCTDLFAFLVKTNNIPLIELTRTAKEGNSNKNKNKPNSFPNHYSIVSDCNLSKEYVNSLTKTPHVFFILNHRYFFFSSDFSVSQVYVCVIGTTMMIFNYRLFYFPIIKLKWKHFNILLSA